MGNTRCAEIPNSKGKIPKNFQTTNASARVFHAWKLVFCYLEFPWNFCLWNLEFPSGA
jgi:hypothetical protein